MMGEDIMPFLRNGCLSEVPVHSWMEHGEQTEGIRGAHAAARLPSHWHGCDVVG